MLFSFKHLINEFLICFSIFFLLSCGEEKVNKENGNTLNIDTIKQALKTVDIISKHDSLSHLNNSINNKILGVWRNAQDTGTDLENGSFDIEKEGIYYPESENGKPFKYKIIRDSINIDYDGYKPTFLITMKGDDTLILTGNEVSKFYRAK